MNGVSPGMLVGIQVLLAGLATALALGLLGKTLGIPAAIGAALATGDMVAIAWAMFLGRSSRLGPKAAVVVLGIKFPVLIGLVYVCIGPLALNPVGFMMGFSSLVMTLVVAGLLAGRKQ